MLDRLNPLKGLCQSLNALAGEVCGNNLRQARKLWIRYFIVYLGAESCTSQSAMAPGSSEPNPEKELLYLFSERQVNLSHV